MRGRRIYRQLLALALCAAAAAWWMYPRRHLPDPKALAAAETRMWQAYYGNDPKALAVELVSASSR